MLSFCEVSDFLFTNSLSIKTPAGTKWNYQAAGLKQKKKVLFHTMHNLIAEVLATGFCVLFAKVIGNLKKKEKS